MRWLARRISPSADWVRKSGRVMAGLPQDLGATLLYHGGNAGGCREPFATSGSVSMEWFPVAKGSRHRLSRHFSVFAFFADLLEDLGEDVVGVDAFGLGFEVEDHAVAHRGD